MTRCLDEDDSGLALGEREEVPPWPWWADLHLRLLVFSRCPDCIGDMGKEAGPVFCCFVCLAYVNMVSSRCPLDTFFIFSQTCFLLSGICMIGMGQEWVDT